jgi:xanthine dehydrogenase YagS FAD-binding subunit
MVIDSASGQRVVSAEDFFVGPNVDITHTTVLGAGDILTAVRIPAKWANAQFYFEKVADRNAWDFALVSLSAAMRVNNGVIEESRIVAGAVQATPRRLTSVEQAVRGKARDEATANSVANLASRDANPLNYNHFKMPLMDNLVKRALRGQA